MLLIGDIHCTSNVIDEIIDTVGAYIQANNDEKTIIFLGDYVYHFSYDRSALLQLFRFFIEQVKAGKSVYVMAGNHDWIAHHFVFSEGQALIDALSGSVGVGSLEFITYPTIKEIAGQHVVFFPYTQLSDTVVAHDDFSDLHNSKNAQEQRSGRANSLLAALIDRAVQQDEDGAGAGLSTKKILVLHHRYINKIAFPGQVARFSYRSPALSEQWLDDDRIVMVSGHLHQPFTYKNYCCVGSVWFTSPLETNQVKYLRRMDAQQVLHATECRIRPYITVPYEQTQIQHAAITTAIQKNRQAAKETINHQETTIIAHCSETPVNELLLKECTLYITTDAQQFQLLEEYCDQEILQSFADVKIKSKHRVIGELLSGLQDASLSLDTSIADWKVLLQRFLVARYGKEEAQQYEALLYRLKVL